MSANKTFANKVPGKGGPPPAKKVKYVFSKQRERGERYSETLNLYFQRNR